MNEDVRKKAVKIRETFERNGLRSCSIHWTLPSCSVDIVDLCNCLLATLDREEKAVKERDGWKFQIECADNILKTYGRGMTGMLHDRVFCVTGHLEEQLETTVQRTKEACELAVRDVIVGRNPRASQERTEDLLRPFGFAIDNAKVEEAP